VLGELRLVTLIIALNFFARRASIFIRGYSVNNSSPLPFQAHFKRVCDLLPQATQISIPPFQQLLERGAYYFQENTSKNVHDHSFFSIISKLSLDCHYTWLKSCVGLGSSAWLSTRPIIPSFRMASNIFSLTLHTRLSLPHPMAHGFSRCICDQTIDPTNNTYFVVLMGERAQPHMMQFQILLLPLLRMSGSMFCMNKHMFSQHHFPNHHSDN
jgi:hypothetical protein